MHYAFITSRRIIAYLQIIIKNNETFTFMRETERFLEVLSILTRVVIQI